MDLKNEYGRRITGHVQVFVLAATAISGIVLAFKPKNDQDARSKDLESELILETTTE